MNEDEWFSDIDFTRHIQFVEARLSARKARLLAAALCRTLGHLHSESHIHQTLETAEEFANGNCNIQILEGYRQRCRETAIRAHEESISLSDVKPDEALRWKLLSELAWAAAFTATTPIPVEKVGQRTAEIVMMEYTGDSRVIPIQIPSTLVRIAERNMAIRALVWDMTGNPFAEIHFAEEWRTSTTIALARGMYQSRDFSAMPILADALQDAGCENPAALEHCREVNGAHVRGCWLVDQVLVLS